MRDGDTDLCKSISLFGVIYNYETITLTLSDYAIAACPDYGVVY